MEGNYGLKFDQHSTVPTDSRKPTHNNTCRKLAELWWPTESMTGGSRSTLDVGFAELVPGSHNTLLEMALTKKSTLYISFRWVSP
jgi:hypothetical protein